MNNTCSTIPFIGQLYIGNIPDREIVIRSGVFESHFDESDSVMADKGFTIEDLLPLGVYLNIPPSQENWHKCLLIKWCLLFEYTSNAR